MKNRSLFMAGALALAGLSLLSAKSYDIIVSSPTKAGTVRAHPRRIQGESGRRQCRFHECG